MTKRNHIIIARNSKGEDAYYTGKAGNEFITTHPYEAFTMTFAGAERTANRLNKVTGPMMGKRFHVVVRDYDAACAEMDEIQQRLPTHDMDGSEFCDTEMFEPIVKKHGFASYGAFLDEAQYRFDTWYAGASDLERAQALAFLFDDH